MTKKELGIKRIPYSSLRCDEKNMVNIPNDVLFNIPNSYHLKVYIYLCSILDSELNIAMATYNKIAEENNISHSTVKRSIKWLAENNYIEKIKIHEDNRNSYRIFIKEGKMEEKIIIEQKIETEETIKKQPEKPPFKFNTKLQKVVIPTRELIKCKDCDFRVLLGISGLTNCDNPHQQGDNTRFVTFEKLNRRLERMCETIGIDISNFNKKVRTLVKKKSDEFKIVDKQGANGKIVKCYEMNYEGGGFVTIPIEKAERCLLTLGNNPIKMYCNLLWLCQSNGEFIPTHVPQSVLAELMGLSPKSEKIVKATMQTLINQDLIEVKKVKELTTYVDKDGLPVTKQTERYLYSIVVDNEDWQK